MTPVILGLDGGLDLKLCSLLSKCLTKPFSVLWSNTGVGVQNFFLQKRLIYFGYLGLLRVGPHLACGPVVLITKHAP